MIPRPGHAAGTIRHWTVKHVRHAVLFFFGILSTAFGMYLGLSGIAGFVFSRVHRLIRKVDDPTQQSEMESIQSDCLSVPLF